MRPLIGIVLADEPPELDDLVGVLQTAVDIEYGHVGLQLLTTEDELRAFQAGHIVLYRKPVKRASSTDVSYRRPDGVVIKREQTTLFEDT